MKAGEPEDEGFEGSCWDKSGGKKKWGGGDALTVLLPLLPLRLALSAVKDKPPSQALQVQP